MKLYGIPNCDRVKKVRKRLEEQGVLYEFVDFKKSELPTELIADWLKQCPNNLVNKRSTTYRNIKERWLNASDDIEQQIKLIQSHPTLIKRPVIEDEKGKISLEN